MTGGRRERDKGRLVFVRRGWKSSSSASARTVLRGCRGERTLVWCDAKEKSSCVKTEQRKGGGRRLVMLLEEQ